MGISVLAVFVAFAVAAAASGERGTASKFSRVLGAEPAAVQVDEAAGQPSSPTMHFKALTAPGNVIVPVGGSSKAAGPLGQQDSACPDNEPCGP